MVLAFCSLAGGVISGVDFSRVIRAAALVFLAAWEGL